MNLIEDTVIPFVGPGCCHNKNCIFYRYKYYHKPIQGCLKWDEFQNQGNTAKVFSSNFKVHEFMDYPSYEIRWRCYNLKCPLLSKHGIHSSALVGCLEHKQFCTYFNVPFQVLYASDQKKKTQSFTSERKINLKKPSVVNTTQDEDEKGLPDLIVYYSDDEVEDEQLFEVEVEDLDELLDDCACLFLNSERDDIICC